jgi:hypothetical protein
MAKPKKPKAETLRGINGSDGRWFGLWGLKVRRGEGQAAPRPTHIMPPARSGLEFVEMLGLDQDRGWGRSVPKSSRPSQLKHSHCAVRLGRIWPVSGLRASCE